MARLHLTGGIRFEGPDGVFDDGDLPGHQGRIAFAALAIERRPLSHDELADIVWSERPPDRWKTALTAVMSKIRRLVSDIGLDGTRVVASSGGTYALAVPTETWVDVEDAMRRLDRAEGALRHGDAATASGEATVATAILRRPLLAGVDCLWLDDARRRQTDALFRCATTLADAWIRLGDHQLAATAAELAIELDPLRETAHRLLIEAERGRGDRGAALRAYARCESTLASEVGVAPSRETRLLAEQLRHTANG